MCVLQETPSLLSSSRPVWCPHDGGVVRDRAGAGRRGSGCPPAAGVWLRASPALVLAECPASLGRLPWGRTCPPPRSPRVCGQGPRAPPSACPGPRLRQSVAPPCRPLRSARPHRTGEEAARAGPPGAGSSCPRPRSAPRGRRPCPRFADGGRGPWLTPGHTASLAERPWGRVAGSGRPALARAWGHRGPRAPSPRGGDRSRRLPLLPPTLTERLPSVCQINVLAPHVTGAVMRCRRERGD